MNGWVILFFQKQKKCGECGQEVEAQPIVAGPFNTEEEARSYAEWDTPFDPETNVAVIVPLETP